MVIILMGAAGAGKTTVGRELAQRLGWRFCDGDWFHSPRNVEKMARGVPLSDDDRRPWLEEIRRAIAEWVTARDHVVLACSLLKESYRATVVADHRNEVKIVYLRADIGLLQRRLAGRQDHFMGVRLLESQLDTLEEPTDALILDASASPDNLIRQIRSALNL
ncbi:MAG TPA: gluconokinase [Nitrospira sp.]|nr:gluconokinase [Nitrospira sp.]